jgi:hypothetical protein
MIGTAFINRETELALFKREFASTSRERNRVIFLVAPTGFGKSEFTEKLIADVHRSVAVKVRIPANIDGDAPFIRELARELNHLSNTQQSIINGADFLRQLKSRRVAHMHDSSLLHDSGDAGVVPRFGPVLARIYDRKSNTGDYDFDLLLRNSSPEALLKLFEYVRNVFTRQPLCVAIENVQVIDNTSERMLQDILTEPRGHFVILEYTPGKSSVHDVSDLENRFRGHGSDTKTARLQPLSVDEIVRQAGIRLDPDTTAELYANFDGNLKNLTDFILVRQTSAAMGSSLEEGTADLVRSQRSSAQVVLALVVAHRSNVSHEALRSLYVHGPQFRETHIDIERALVDLEKSRLIRSDRGTIEPDHDSVAAEVEKALSGQLTAAYRAWASYYREKLETRDFADSSRDQVLDYLFSFYARIDPSKLQPLLGDIRLAALSSFTLKRAEMLLRRVEESLAEFDTSLPYQQELRWKLIDTYYDAGLYDLALGALHRVRTKPMRRAVMRAAVLDRVDRHAEAIDLISSTLSTTAPRHDSFELSLRLIEMICYRSLNDYESCARVHREIGSVSAYRALSEYGFYLRNAEIVLPVAASIPLLEESVAWFARIGNGSAEAQSRIALGMELIRLGELNDAEAQLDRAEALLAERRLDWHIIYNNRAVLTMYRGEADLEVVDELLRKAYLTANIAFDRVAIDNNRLAAHAMAGDYAFCATLIESLEQAAREMAEEVLLCITLYNISVYHGRRGATGQQARYLSMSRQCNNDWPEYWANRYYGTPITADPAAKYVAQYPFDLVLLSTWHIEVSDFAERS